MIESPNGPLKVLGATTTDENRYRGNDVSGGIPIIMSKQAYESIDTVERNGVIKATVTGTCIEVPKQLENRLMSAPDVPRFCIYVGSQRNITKEHYTDDVSAAGWTIYEDQQNREYNMAFSTFNAVDVQDGPSSAGAFWRNYISDHNGMALTDFDEKTLRLEAAIPINSLSRGDIDRYRFQELVDRIERRYNLNQI